MTQQVINTGAVANDGTGDPLRSAFIKADDNFDAIWAYGPVDTNIKISGTTITATSTNGNITLAPNGIGSVITTNVLPSTSNVYTLGSSTAYYNSAHITTVNTPTLAATAITATTITGGTIAGSHTGTFDGDLTGSVFADDSSLLVDGINSTATLTALTTGNVTTTPQTVTSTSPGTAGQIAVDADYVYVCTATNTWKRAALSTF
jgi:hypothetical protein